MGQVLFFGKQPKPNRENVWIDPRKRIVHVMLCKGMNKVRTGVYKLCFDNYFYIGRANNIRSRVKGHMKELELAVNKENPKGNYQRNMLKFLKDNPNFHTMSVEILEECLESELNSKENYWLNMFSSDKGLLNVTAYAIRTSQDKTRADFKPGIYKVEFSITTLQQFIDYKELIKKTNVVSSSLIN